MKEMLIPGKSEWIAPKQATITAIIKLILTTWQSLEKPNIDEIENKITERFQAALKSNRKFKKNYPYIRIEWEFRRTRPPEYQYMGNIDIVFLSGRSDNDYYFAIECKRLNLPKRTGAPEYVGKDGMMCFVTGKYSGDLNSAGMIGYVMDGNLEKAVRNVRNNVNKNIKSLCLKFGNNETLKKSLLFKNERCVFETEHDVLSNRVFVIYHIFLKA